MLLYVSFVVIAERDRARSASEFSDVELPKLVLIIVVLVVDEEIIFEVANRGWLVPFGGDFEAD